MLTNIRTALEAGGTHSQHWGELRREVFSGEESWANLKAWCEDNAYECELAFSQSSKAAHVQFRRKRKVAAAAVSTPAA